MYVCIYIYIYIYTPFMYSQPCLWDRLCCWPQRSSFSQACTVRGFGGSRNLEFRLELKLEYINYEVTPRRLETLPDCPPKNSNGDST